jgi:hypothetical protein
MISIITLAIGFAIRTTPRFVAVRPPSRILLSASDSELVVREAAIRVVAAAYKFGQSQGDAAAEWVMEAMGSRSGEVDCDGLLGKQKTLFDECLLEESGKCEELDNALTSLESQLKEGEAGPVDALVGLFGQSKLDRASARVLKAASNFGAEQEKIASDWVSGVRESGGAMNPVELLEQQELLFGECLLDEEGYGPEKCHELTEALGALQRSLGVEGRVVSTATVGELAAKRND